MDNNFTNMNPLGEDSIKGGIFFGSSLTPTGSFSNVPKFLKADQIAEKEASLVLTLQKVKDQLRSRLEEETGGATDNEESIEQFLHDFTGLLIDYRDLRNYIFYGSANTELAYNIRHIIETYPYSTLVGQKIGTNLIDLKDVIIGGREYTEIIFPEKYVYPQSPKNFDRIIVDNYNRFNFFDDDSSFDWNKYEVVDKNGRRLKIKKVTTPYKSPSIFKVKNIANSIALDSHGLPYNTIRVTLDANQVNLYTVGTEISFTDLACTDPNKVIEVKVTTSGTTTPITYNYEMNSKSFIVMKTGLTSGETWIEIRRADAQNMYEDLELEANPYLLGSGIVRKHPLDQNTRPYVVKIVVEGRLTYDSFILFDVLNDSRAGFMISPKINIVNDWEIGLTPIQKQLLAPSPINPTPWPRRTVTNNIQNIADGDDYEQAFYNWLQSPTSMYVKKLEDEEDTTYGTDLYYEYRLVRALVLDETYSNQIIRRMIPHELISELNDTEDFYFQRFILIAGWFFDQIRLYVKFIKHAHTINHNEFDQLSPEYYRYYSDYYGLDLFNDDSIDFTKLVIKTEPGYYYIDDASQSNNKYYRQTLQKMQFERQKRLLLSLFYLYKIKGTQACINQLISLLGAPDGFLAFNEYAFAVDHRNNVGYPTQGYAGRRIIDNEKVHTPSVSFEIDPDYLIDKTNIDNPINKPYVYRQLYDNEYIHNLREVTVHTDPSGAIDKQIQDIFGKQRYNYITFGKGEYATLQNLNYKGDYFLLPLSLPDRFYGFSVDYMIPREGFKKGVGSNTEESTVNIMSLYEISGIPSKSPLTVTAVSLSPDQSTATVTTATPHGYTQGENVFFDKVGGIININNRMFEVLSVVSPNEFTIFGDFSNVYTSGGTVLSGELPLLMNSHTGNVVDDPSTPFTDEGYVARSMDYTYPLAVNYSNRNSFGDSSFAKDSAGVSAVGGYTNPITDFNTLLQRYPTSQWVDDSYVIIRLEGNDLVFRIRMRSEVLTSLGAPHYEERVAILPNIFRADGLNHSLRMILRPEGAEVFQDFEFKGLARWIEPSTLHPYKPYEIPKSEILAMQNAADDCFDYFSPMDPAQLVAFESVPNQGKDKINWWDMFIGMPTNVEFWFKKLSFFENNTINDFNIGDRITDSAFHTAEFYVFEPADPVKGSTVEKSYRDFALPGVFNPKVPNAIPEYYAYVLPQTKDQYNRNIIPLLNLSKERYYDENGNSLLVNRRQDFFKFEKLFENNAWQPNQHKTYEYDLFNGDLHKLYLLYSSQVLSYESLSEFLDLVEGKFKSVFEQFIPIVINLLEFGRLIKNSNFHQAKFRIPGNDKVCQGVWLSNKSFTTSMLWETDAVRQNGLRPGMDIEYNILTTGGQTIVAAQTIAWDTNKYVTSRNLVSAINGDPANVSGLWHAQFIGDQFKLEVDYDAFLAKYGESANNIVFRVWQLPTASNNYNYIKEYQLAFGNPAGQGIHPDVFNHCGDKVQSGFRDEEVCGSVTYSLPNTTLPPVWVYYESENKPAIYPRYASELTGDVVIVKKSTE